MTPAKDVTTLLSELGTEFLFLGNQQPRVSAAIFI